MTELARFFVPGPVVAKMRARHARRGAHVVTYTPDKQVSYEAHVRACALAAWDGAQPLDQPLRVSVHVTVGIPRSWSKKKQREAVAGRLRPTGRGDLDNYCKSIFDALNGILWRDDALIVGLGAAKIYGAVPGVDVIVRDVAEGGL